MDLVTCLLKFIVQKLCSEKADKLCLALVRQIKQFYFYPLEFDPQLQAKWVKHCTCHITHILLMKPREVEKT